LNEQFGYAYDPAGNLNWRTNNAMVEGLTVNNLNELASETNAGTLTVEGTTTSAATNVTVNGLTANRYGDNTFALGGFTVANGNNSFTAIAKDSFGRTDTNMASVFLQTNVLFAYDLNGNLLNDGNRYFSYDDENELISVTISNAWRSEFVYDGKMRRRIRREYSWQNNAWLQTNEVHYVYDADLVIQERDVNNLALVSYTRGRDFSGTLQGAGGIGGLLARTDNRLLTIADPDAHAYYHADANGNVTCLLSTNQVTAARYLYDPYGNTLSLSGPLANVNLCRFSAKEFHPNSGLTYYLRRFYVPDLQRWLNRDPIAERGGMNLYGFVLNSPTRDIDTEGLDNAIVGSDGLPLSSSSGLADPGLFLTAFQRSPRPSDRCAALRWSIANVQGDIRGVMISMQDLDPMFLEIEKLQNQALIGEALLASVGGIAMGEELEGFNLAPYRYGNLRISSAVGAGAFTITLDEAALRGTGGLTSGLLRWNIINSAESAAELEDEMVSSFSESSYQALRGLQGNLAALLKAYDKECPCHK
jgi:RHS repeat-associated protein